MTRCIQEETTAFCSTKPGLMAGGRASCSPGVLQCVLDDQDLWVLERHGPAAERPAPGEVTAGDDVALLLADEHTLLVEQRTQRGRGLQPGSSVGPGGERRVKGGAQLETTRGFKTGTLNMIHFHTSRGCHSRTSIERSASRRLVPHTDAVQDWPGAWGPGAGSPGHAELGC